MALVILDRQNASEANQPLSAITNLRRAIESIDYIVGLNGNATDADITSVFGVPVGDVTAFKNTFANVATALDDPAVTSLLTNLI